MYSSNIVFCHKFKEFVTTVNFFAFKQNKEIHLYSDQVKFNSFR